MHDEFKEDFVMFFFLPLVVFVLLNSRSRRNFAFPQAVMEEELLKRFEKEFRGGRLFVAKVPEKEDDDFLFDANAEEGVLVVVAVVVIVVVIIVFAVCSRFARSLRFPLLL